MGYYTKYDLECRPEEKTEEAIAKLFPDSVHEEYDPLEERFKWYEHETHLIKLSLEPEFKDVLFILDGVGEEYGDEWRKFFFNGKSEHINRPRWTPPEQPLNLK